MQWGVCYFECTDGVDKVESIATIAEYPDSDFGVVADEFNTMLVALEQVGVGVFLADSKYFPCWSSWCLSYRWQ